VRLAPRRDETASLDQREIPDDCRMQRFQPGPGFEQKQLDKQIYLQPTTGISSPAFGQA
jgi:hypothetical protein